MLRERGAGLCERGEGGGSGRQHGNGTMEQAPRLILKKRRRAMWSVAYRFHRDG
jgi:hypothetical protein